MSVKNFFKKLVDDHGGTKVTKLDMIALGLGDFGYGVVSSTVATYITSFGTMALPGVSQLGFTATLMGIAVGIAVIFDAISDPIMGFISDHFKSKTFGKRHLFMLIGLIGMMTSALAVWYIPYQGMSAAGIFIWFTVFLILLRTFNTMYYTPVGAFSVEMSNDYDERTTIQSVRSVFYIVGMLLCVVLMGTFQNKYAGFYATSADGKIIEGIEYIKGKTIEIAWAAAQTKFGSGIVLDTVNNSFVVNGVTYFFRKGQQIQQGYIDFALFGTVSTVITSTILLVVTSRYIKILQKRDEAIAALKGIDLNAPKPKILRADVRKELEAKANGKRVLAITVRNELQRRRADAGHITLGGVLRNFFGTFKVKEMRTIAIGYVIAMMSATLIISLGFNVFTFTFELRTLQMYILMGALLICTIGSQLVWGKLAKKKSKEFAMFTGLIISFVGCVLLFVEFLLRKQINALLLSDLSALGVIILAPPLMIAGFGTGVLYSMPLALVGDVVVLQNVNGGEDKTGTYAGVMTFCYKVGQGIVTAISTALLDAIGFVSGNATQPQSAKDGIGWILCVGVVVFVGLGILVFSRLKLDKAKIEEILHKQQEAGAEHVTETEGIADNGDEELALVAATEEKSEENAE